MFIQQEISFNDAHPVPYDDLTPNKMVSVYLMASYLYYILNESPMRDYEYDLLCQQLLNHYNDINHMHKHLLDVDSLKAGTAFHLKESDYPNMVKGAAKMWLSDVHSRLGLGGNRRKKSKTTSLKTITVIDDTAESLQKGVNALNLNDPKIRNMRPYLSRSVIAEIEYLDD